MFKIILVIMGFSHLVACFWYGLSVENVAGDSGTWVHNYFSLTDDVGYRYTTSLHWSLAQFSGGLDEISPANLVERIYAVVVFLIAFMMGAVLVSSLTSSMTQLRILANEKSTKLTTLRRYLNDNGISNRLALRVQRNAHHAMLEQQRYIPEANVELLTLVSEPLRIELHFEMYAKVLANHPFFDEYTYSCPHIMQKVCHSATSMTQVSNGDIVFNVGEIPPKPKMILVVSGTLHYVPMSVSGRAGGRVSRTSRKSRRSTTVVPALKGGVDLAAGQWISEPVLWTHWMHRGILTATHDCRLCLLDAQRFGDTVCAFDLDEFNPKVYAAEFVKGLNTCNEELSDIPLGLEMRALDKLEKVIERMKGKTALRRNSTHSMRSQNSIAGLWA